MLASTQVELPFNRGIGRQHEWGFCALAQVIKRTAIPILRKKIVPVAKWVSADLLQFALPEIADVVCGRRKFKTVAKSVGRQTSWKQLGSGSGKKTASRNFPKKKSPKQTNRSQRDIFTSISHYPCWAVFGTNLLWQVL